MNKIKEYLAKKKFSIYIVAASFVLLLLGFIMALVTGAQEGDLTAGIVILYIVGLLSLIVTAIKDFYSAGLLVSSVCSLAAFLLLLVPRLNMIGLILNNVVEAQIWPLFIVAGVFTILSAILNCVVAFLGVEKKEAEPTEEKTNTAE